MTHLSRLFAPFLALLIIGGAAPRADAASPDEAAAFVQDLGDRAISLLTDQQISEREHVERFRGLLHEGFDIPTIGQFVLGRYWRTASEAEREEYLRLFEAWVVQIYADRFREYSGETFRVAQARPDADGAVLVLTEIVRPQDPNVRVDWRVVDTPDGPKIVDVIVEGVSMSVTQRSEFASVIQRGGGRVETLLAALRQRVDAQGG